MQRPAIAVACAAALLAILALPTLAQTLSRKEVKTMRKEAAFKQRRLIFNNDGDDVFSAAEATPETLLAVRTTALLDSHVGAITYSTTRSFGLFTHDSKVCEPWDHVNEKHPLNIPGELIRQGKGPLQVMIDACRENDLDIFWGMRMNDTHDATNDFLLPQWKLDNPGYIMGTRDQRFKHGKWSSVDYTLPAVRQKAYEIIEDVVTRYDIDGVELDFYRHPVLFRSHAVKGKADPEDMALLTDLLRRVRQMCDRVAAERGKPILIAMRAPDSIGYANAVGIDLETLITENIIDIFEPSGYVQFVPWSESVKLCHDNGVACYPCLSNCTMSDLRNRALRGTLEAYRARATNVWDAGADGIQIFNVFNPKHPLWTQLGDPEFLKGTDKHYFVTYLGSRMVRGYYYDGMQFYTNPSLCPDAPITLQPSIVESETLDVGEDICEVSIPEVTLKLQFENLEGTELFQMRMNDIQLEPTGAEENWLLYTVPPDIVRHGSNLLQFRLRGKASAPLVLRDATMHVLYPKNS